MVVCHRMNVHKLHAIDVTLSIHCMEKGRQVELFEYQAEKKRFAEETRRRMSRAITLLSATDKHNIGGFQELIRLISDQESASAAAGYERVARLCQSMDDCLSDIQYEDAPNMDAVVSTLAEVCEAIRVHADAVGAIAAELSVQPSIAIPESAAPVRS
jgi:hypothetical protein